MILNYFEEQIKEVEDFICSIYSIKPLSLELETYELSEILRQSRQEHSFH